MAGQFETGHDCLGQGPDTVAEYLDGTAQRQDGAVVERIAVGVEQAGTGRPGQLGDQGGVATFADVDHALEHGSYRGIDRRGTRPPGEARRRLTRRGISLVGMTLANIFGPDLLIVVILAVVLLFGAGQLPKLARSMGEASKEFKKSQMEAEEEAKKRAAASATSPSDEKVTMTKAELDALLAEREARARRESEIPPAP